MVLDAMQQRLAQLLAVHPPSLVGRDAKLGLERLQIEEEKVAVVVASDFWVDLDLFDGLQCVLVQELREKGQSPVNGNGPSVTTGIDMLVALEDLERNIGL